jgi:hypothetical protein
MKNEFYLDQLLGRPLVAGNNRPVGRVEEFHCEQDGDVFRIVEVAIGSGGLMERLNVGVKALFGIGSGGKLARWDQIDISNPERPRLICTVDELRDV